MTVERDGRYDDLDAATVAVRDLIGESRQMSGRMAALIGMNPNDMQALGALTINGQLGVAELAKHLGIRSASATAMVDRLEQAGHVTRIRDTVDRRRVSVVQTDTSRNAAFEAWSPIVRAIDEVARSLPEADRAVVRDFLDRVTEVIRASPAPEVGS